MSIQSYASSSPISKISGLLRTHGVSGTFRHARTVLLHKAHSQLDRRLKADARDDRTALKVELSDVSIASANRESGVHYLPTPWRVLDWVHEALPSPTRDWSFVDFGAGKGRVLLSAGRRRYGRVIGVEFARELADAARGTIARGRGIRATRIEVVEGDATEYDLPETPTVVFMFNPFGPPVIDKVPQSIARSYRSAPRPIVIAYLNPQHPQVFSGLDGFREFDLPARLATRFRLLSPYQLKLYVTAEPLGTDGGWATDGRK